nr:MAG TPA: hypothetical protein [Caudoviricetes sp.]
MPPRPAGVSPAGQAGSKNAKRAEHISTIPELTRVSGIFL